MLTFCGRRDMIKSLSDNLSKLGLTKRSSTDSSVNGCVERKKLTLLHDVDIPYEKATFGMGCFWGADSLYGGTKGILRTRVGYCGGTKLNPVYRNLGDHTEAIDIDYDPKTISYLEILNLFWNNHEYGLTTKIKKQYASIIFYHSEDQKRIAEESRVHEQKIRSNEKIITTIVEAGEFHSAEDYHQKFRLQNHKDLAKTLGLNSRLLLTSHVAARLNGYVAGIGSVEQFEEEAAALGLNEKQKKYTLEHLIENEGGLLYC
ncbi:CLUMA_CG019985, isoform A [Clunio marinus]|uniref:peptide-methionine (S)-S-oxide reductase n=1 Tax=Clunio marinus TaxID=568069 RepID=A0A1J1J3M2_9DIPT|nr:CLUMA_CG019985, isoform A [Clunio marinus]